MAAASGLNVEANTITSTLTPRQQREREFFEEYWLRHKEHLHVNLRPIRAKERRPWNPYWYVLEAVKSQYEGGARKLLDFGCGAGTDAVMFGSLGFEVSGFDISPRCVEIAKQLSEAHGLSDRMHFSVQASENLNYPNDYFDVVVGIDVLHHVEIAPSVKECVRVLRPGGVAYFREWVEVPSFDRVRNTPFVRSLCPNGRNIDRATYITEDERKMTAEDIEAVRELCHTLTEKRFYVFARFDRLIRLLGYKSFSFIEPIDYWLCKKIPGLGRWGGSVVLECRKAAIS